MCGFLTLVSGIEFMVRDGLVRFRVRIKSVTALKVYEVKSGWCLHDNELPPRKKEVRFINVLNKGENMIALKINKE